MKTSVRTNVDLLIGALRKISFQIADAEISKQANALRECRGDLNAENSKEAENDRQS